MMEDFQSETDSDYTSYWRDWVCILEFVFFAIAYGLSFLLGRSQDETSTNICPRSGLDCRSTCHFRCTHVTVGNNQALVHLQDIVISLKAKHKFGQQLVYNSSVCGRDKPVSASDVRLRQISHEERAITQSQD
jgi:hypothetical protein